MPHTGEHIDRRFLTTGHFLGLKFSEGWWFTNILETEFSEIKPFTLNNENGNKAAIAAQTAGNEDRIQDSSSNDIIIPDDDEKQLIFQTLFGIRPARAQVFFLSGRNRNRAIQDYDEPGDLAPIVNGLDSPYNNPNPQAFEMFTINDIAAPKLEAFNPMDEAKEVKVSIHVEQLKYATITDIDMMRAFLEGQINAKLQPAGAAGSLRQTQVRAPTWLQNAFGEHIKTTEEIFKQSTKRSVPEQQNGSDSSLPEVPGLSGGTEER